MEMPYRNVGRSGLRIGALSIGGWITFGGSIKDRVAHRILDTAVERGVNFIDLADVYARGGAERAVGKWLVGRDRSKLVISSKCFWPMSDDPNDRGLSRKHVRESVERSLTNLGTDYLDILFCHREDPETPLEETASVMDDLVHEGKLHYWGTSVWSAERLREAHALAADRNWIAPRVEQPCFNLLQRGIERDVLPAARELGMGVVAWSPLAGGVLTGKYDDGIPPGSRGATTKWLEDKLTEPVLERVRAFSGLARDLGVRPAQLALAWVISRDGLTSAITGATSPAQLEENLGALDVEITPEVEARLDDLFPIEEAPAA